MPSLLSCSLFLASWLLLDLSVYLGTKYLSVPTVTWLLAQGIESAQGNICADTAEEARTSSPFVSRESQNHRIL